MTEVNVTSHTNYNLNQQYVDTIHDVIVTECDKYPQKIILKPETILDGEIKLHNIYILIMTPNNKRPLLNCTCVQ